MILIIGAGAVGTSLGYFLHQAGQAIHFWVRNERLSHYHQLTALRIEYSDAKPADSIPPPAVTDGSVFASDDPSYNAPDSTPKYALICVKHSQLNDILPQLAGLPKSTVIVPCLNGVLHLEWLAEQLPHHRIEPLTVNFNAQLISSWHANITTTPQIYLSPSSKLFEYFKTVKQLDVQAGSKAVCWGKLLINLNNPIGALTNSTFKDMLLDPAVRNIYLALLDEAVAVLRQANIPFVMPTPVPYWLQRWVLEHTPKLAWLIAKKRNGITDQSYPSMHADLTAGRETEIKQINGAIVALAEQHGITASKNTMMVKLVEQHQLLNQQKPTSYLSPRTVKTALDSA